MGREEIYEKDQAWNAAKKDLIEGTITITDTRLLNCLKYGTPGDMTDGCLKKLLKAYKK